jgi:RND family efflux transporter MFP subunit
MARRRAAAMVCGCLLALSHGRARAATESFDCLMNPSATLKIGSPVESTLESVSVGRGDHVTKGQEIARLVSSVEAATVALDETRAGNLAEIKSRVARVEAAQAEVNRGSRLQEGFSVTGQKLDELRTQLRLAQQDLALAELNHTVAQLELARSQAQLALRVIRSPVDGIISQRVLGPGEFVHQDNQIVVVATIDPLFVEVYPPVRFYGLIRRGDAATVQPEAPVGGSYSATVAVVDQVFDAGSGTFGIRLALPNPDQRLPAGLRCRAVFTVAE